MERKTGRGTRRTPKAADPELDELIGDEALPDLLGDDDEPEESEESEGSEDPEDADTDFFAEEAPPPSKRAIAAPATAASPAASEGDAVDLASDLPIQVVAVLGKKTITMRDLLAMRSGEVIDLGRAPSEVVDLVASGKLIAKGELVDVDGKLGVRIIKMLK